jgi:hypothetical protein
MKTLLATNEKNTKKETGAYDSKSRGSERGFIENFRG